MAKKADAKPGKRVASAPAHSDVETVAISRALADTRRFAVLRHIATSDAVGCSHLRETLGINAATLSHHIKQLQLAGLIETRREGKAVVATLRRKALKNYVAALKDLAR